MNQWAVPSKFPPAFRPGDLVAVCPEKVGSSGANISRFAKYSGYASSGLTTRPCTSVRR